MRLILLLLALTANVYGLKLDFWKELRISNQKMEIFKESMGGIDLEERFLKLRNLSSRSKVAKLTEEQEKELKERTAKIKKVVVEKPPGVNAIDLFEINEQNGIANFLYEGDINLTEEELDQLTNSADATSKVTGSRIKRGAALRDATKWPNGIVYYYLDPNVTSNAAKSAAINAAIEFLQSKTCIRFINSEVEPNRIRVTHGQGCWSFVGMAGGVQPLSIGNGCDNIGKIAHEFTHALGFKHMQSRYDRDDYVTVDVEAIRPGKMHNFQKLTINNSINYTPYEYGGFMQYQVNSFALNQSVFTMTPVDIDYVHTMGNRMISFYDVKMINDHYECSAKCADAAPVNCQNGGIQNPNNCATCNCPRGYAGALCDQMPPPSGGCGAELNATSDWQSKSFQYGKNSFRNEFTECHHWIKAPAGSQIEVRITEMRNEMCNYGCQNNGIEFKLKDQRMTNPKICCRAFLNVTYTAELNPLPVIAHNTFRITEFTIQYRYVGGPEVTTVQPTVSTTREGTTTTTVSSANCVDVATTNYCADRVNEGFCTNSQYSFQIKKYYCGKSCNLCGKKADPCIDLQGRNYCESLRSNGQCTTLPPFQAEYYCAATCGFCEHPN